MEPTEALRAWACEGEPRPAADAGLINRTWWVGDPPKAVLQWVNPIFDPAIHLDVEAITARLAEAGLGVPRLLPTRRGALYLAARDGCWRLLTYLPGRTFHCLDDPLLAAEAGRYVGRFHAALDGWGYTCRAPRRDIHDTPARMAELEAALEAADGHPFEGPVRAAGARILDAWRSWQGDLDLPERLCHGDLKISNLRFDTAGERAVGILDLDTLGPQTLAAEMGDAWRSWCNPAGEDDPEDVRFDLGLFAASARAWLAEVRLEEAERRSLVPGIERICLELAARFCADVVRGCYFREDRRRFPGIGEHNLVRARSQLALAGLVREARAACEAVLRGG